MTKNIAAVLLGIGLILSTFAFATPANADIDPNTANTLANGERVARGLSPLKMDSRLTEVAAEKVADQIARGYLSHYAPDGSMVWPLVLRHGYTYTYVGENIALWFGDERSMIDKFMQSPTHRANLLSPNYTDTGIASRVVARYGQFPIVLYVQIFAAEE